MKNIRFLLLAGFLLLYSCDPLELTTETQEYSVSGLAQKGPFILGSDVDVYSLDQHYVQTGVVYNAQIEDNAGSFTLEKIKLSSKYVRIAAEGYYFNEIRGEVSTAPITLYALADLSENNNVNVNLMTHLQRLRMETLVDEGRSFKEAKQQSMEEVLKVFHFDPAHASDSSNLSITGENEEDAMLLAMSVILLGNRTDAELSELLAQFLTDIESDGTLEDTVLMSKMVSDAFHLNTGEIRTKLEERYSQQNMEVSLPDFEKYLAIFLDSSNLEVVESIEYPETGAYGTNVLNMDFLLADAHVDYSLTADIPDNQDVIIRMSGGGWFYALGSEEYWKVSQYDFDNNSQTFTSTEAGVTANLKFRFDYPRTEYDSATHITTVTGDSILVEYFENSSETPTFSKIITYNEQ